MRLLSLAAALAALPLSAKADVFDLVAGSWGLTDRAELSCDVNPHEISFSADRARAEFRWEVPMFSYKDDWRLEGGYTILGHDATSLTMALDGESRLTDSGEPVVWVLRVQEDGSRYCWSRTDWSPDQCIDRYRRCTGPAPVS